MGIVGVGIDLVSITEFAEQVDQPGTLFSETFTPGERRDASDKSSSAARHLAARWAAKEAISKCFTTGIGAELGWKSASVYHGSRQEPLVRLDEKGLALLQRVNASHVFVSLSHTEASAMAVAAVVRA